VNQSAFTDGEKKMAKRHTRCLNLVRLYREVNHLEGRTGEAAAAYIFETERAKGRGIRDEAEDA
jgi:hypothetical protein